VDANHPDQVALMRGPLVLFALSDSQPSFERADLLRAKFANNQQADSTAVATDGRPVTMRPFSTITQENYSTYVSLKS